MKAISAEPKGTNSGGGRVVQAFIVADNTPATLPTSGASVDGLYDTDTFAPFSVLYVVADVDAKVYITNESGVFIPQ